MMFAEPDRLSASIRRRAGVAAGVVAALGVFLSACGAFKGRGPSVDTVTLRGTVSTRGGTPFGAGYLEATDGVVYILQDGPVSRELRALHDMDVELEAILLEQKLGDMPVLDVRSYELLPLATGERPIVGFIQANPISNYIYLVDKGGMIYHIYGDFRRTLMDYNGAKAWVVGDVEFSPTRLQERTIQVTAYGIIAERGGLEF